MGDWLMYFFSNLDRLSRLARLKDSEFDLLIIGGGITGVGIALDAVTRGLKTVLVDMQDFSAGTSSRSTKLIHGGLRYLKQFEVRMVREVGRERAIVYENGPHVTTPERMLLPIYKGGWLGRVSTSLGLRLYDFLAAVPHKERRRMLNVRETLDKEPLLKQEGLLGSGYYVEYRTDDARLTIEVAKKAVEHGAALMNYLKVIEFTYRENQLNGVIVEDQLSGETFRIRAKKLVNATGPWVDEVRKLDQSKTGPTLKQTKGVHIVIDRKRFPIQQAIYFDASDGRMLFAIPRGEKTYIGTTDTFYQEDLQSPKINKEDSMYLLQEVNHQFQIHLKVTDIESSWAGIRPLISGKGRNPSEISRKDEIWHSSSGMLSIAGGKLTGYRKMAERVVDEICDYFKQEFDRLYAPCQTKKLPISGGEFEDIEAYRVKLQVLIKQGMDMGLDEIIARKLASTYGMNVVKLYSFILEQKQLDAYGMPVHLTAMLRYAIEEEQIVSPVDFLLRRTGMLLFDMEEAQKWRIPILNYMNDTFLWSLSERALFEQNLAMEMELALVNK